MACRRAGVFESSSPFISMCDARVSESVDAATAQWKEQSGGDTSTTNTRARRAWLEIFEGPNLRKTRIVLATRCNTSSST